MIDLFSNDAAAKVIQGYDDFGSVIFEVYSNGSVIFSHPFREQACAFASEFNSILQL